MYKHFFGLRENPFNVNPDPRYLFLTPQTQRALDELKCAIQARKGLILLTGDVGTGKTTLINRLLNQLGEQRTPTAFIFNSHIEINHLFDFILADFCVPLDSGLNNTALMRLNRWLLERYRAGETPVLIVDEAQGLPTHVLEEIRMLLNLETPREKLLQIVLVGQPELEERIKRPELRQIKQRVALRCKTAALALKETREYIQSRLDIAGANGKPVFVPQAIDAVHFYSRGIPRVMNLLCENALINAYVNHVQPVPVQIIAEIAYKFQFDDVKPIAPPRGAGNILDFYLIAPQSRSGNLLVSSPATSEPPLKEHVGAITKFVSPSLVVADNVLSPVKGPAPPGLDCEKIPELKGDVESSRPGGVQVTTPPASQPARTETSRPSELSEFFSDVGIQFFSGSAIEAAPLALPSLPLMVEAKGKLDFLAAPSRGQVSSPRTPSRSPAKVGATKSGVLRSGLMKIIALGLILDRSSRGKDRLFSSVISPARVLSTTIVLQQLKRLLQPVRVLYRRCFVWRNRCLHFVGPLDWPVMTASVYRWLRQPWNPTPWRLRDSRWSELLRRFSHKKA
jgi:type II secretory pathway predicted ATPase ExeA